MFHIHPKILRFIQTMPKYVALRLRSNSNNTTSLALSVLSQSVVSLPITTFLAI